MLATMHVYRRFCQATACQFLAALYYSFERSFAAGLFRQMAGGSRPASNLLWALSY